MTSLQQKYQKQLKETLKKHKRRKVAFIKIEQPFKLGLLGYCTV